MCEMADVELHVEDFSYNLPPHLIAQAPAERRDASRLMVLDRSTQTIQHDTFERIGEYLREGDALVANRSRVIPARLTARRSSGGRVEVFLLKYLAPGLRLALCRPTRKLREGEVLSVSGSALSAHLEEQKEDGQWVVRFRGLHDVDAAVQQAGSIPLPPYIDPSHAPLDRYQTVYADRDGSVAAPTAGLHFSSELLDALRRQGIKTFFVTLHVGLGTFRPVTVESVANHRMHAEWGEVPEETAGALNHVREAGGRLVSVGTTTTRLLESAVSDGCIRGFTGETDRFIYPGYRFAAIDALVTNFHLPRSTLLMLVSAFAGTDFIREAYAAAIREGYRFYSFGDAMLIL
jgi:S-adenosylmethionine:tRNA ribosyltransferase-isomerase